MAPRSVLGLLFAVNALGAPLRIQTGTDAGPFTSLAARELRRYLFIGGFLPGESLAEVFSSVNASMIVTITTTNSTITCAPPEVLSALRDKAEGYALTRAGAEICVTGVSDTHALYGVYTLLEMLGFFFSSTNPVIPGKLNAWPVDGFQSVATPAFTTRGLQPFHGNGLEGERFCCVMQRG